MSNILARIVATKFGHHTSPKRQRGVRVEIFRIPNLAILLIFITFSVAGAAAPIRIDRSRLADIEDNTPLARYTDRPAWDYLFHILREHSAEEIEKNAPEAVGFRDLDRQPVEYRGRTVRISGRLIRCEFLPIARAPGPFDEDDTAGRNGVYESWILVDDKKDVPISVCSLEIPDGFPLGDELNEAVDVTGFFYKRRLFLSVEDEEVVTPTILAKTLRWFPAVPGETPTGKTAKENRWLPLAVSILCLIPIWLVLRLMSRRVFPGKHSRRPPIRFGDSAGDDEFDGKIVIPEKPEQKTDDAFKIIPVFLAPAFFLFGGISVADTETKPVDAEFTRMLLQMDQVDWDTLGDENIPLEQQQEAVFEMMNRLRRFVPASFLKNGISETIRPKDDESELADRGLLLVDDPAQFRGRAFRLEGFAVRVEDLPLNPAEQKSHEIPSVYRCRFLVPGQGCADVLVSFVPDEWKRNEAIRERAALTGIFVKRIRFEEKASENGAVDLQHPIRSEMLPLLVATRIEWFPNTFLGNLGFDVGSFDPVPPLRIADLKKKTLDVAPPLRLLNRNALVRRAFKFTEVDRDPFYGLLKATAATPPGRIEQEAREILKRENRKETPAVSLFNDPAGTRGTPALLHGVAKRVQTILVDDPEVQTLYGIKRYYEIYLYTEDSQGLPLVACVTSLPEGMPVGSAPDYNEPVSIGAIPYKLWVYESSVELEGGEGYKPSYAPLLVGRSPIWHPRPKAVGPPPGAEDSGDMRTTISFTIFFVLLIVWFVFRRVKLRRTIEFKLKK